MSWAVMTAWTPGICLARVVSTRTNRACGMVLRTYLHHSMPAKITSAP